jgi:hypothetical protein
MAAICFSSGFEIAANAVVASGGSAVAAIAAIRAVIPNVGLM